MVVDTLRYAVAVAVAVAVATAVRYSKTFLYNTDIIFILCTNLPFFHTTAPSDTFA